MEWREYRWSGGSTDGVEAVQMEWRQYRWRGGSTDGVEGAQMVWREKGWSGGDQVVQIMIPPNNVHPQTLKCCRSTHRSPDKPEWFSVRSKPVPNQPRGLRWFKRRRRWSGLDVRRRIRLSCSPIVPTRSVCAGLILRIQPTLEWSPTVDRLVGLVVKAPASRAKDPGFDSRLRRDFSGSSCISDVKIGPPVAALPGPWQYGTGRPGVRVL